jgi:hypothetical protein
VGVLLQVWAALEDQTVGVACRTVNAPMTGSRPISRSATREHILHTREKRLGGRRGTRKRLARSRVGHLPATHDLRDHKDGKRTGENARATDTPNRREPERHD